MFAKKRIACWLLFFMIVSCFGGWPSPQLVRADGPTTSVLALDFEGAHGPAAVLSNAEPSLLTIGSGDFTTDGKTNGTGSSAAGTFAAVSAGTGQSVAGVNVSPAAAVAAAAKNALNTLAPGTYDIKLSLDYDIVSRNDTRSPYLWLRLFGTNAVTGAAGSSYVLVAAYADNRAGAPVGDDLFATYTATVPIKLFPAADSANDDGNGKTDKFVAGSFTTFDLRIATYSTTAANPSIIDFDNIKVDAVLTSEPPPLTAVSYVGEERTVQGNWIGVYGGDGYVLPFYSTTRSSGRDNPLAADVADLPVYVSDYSKYGSNYSVIQNPSSDTRALLNPADPDPAKRKKLVAYSGSTFEETFYLTDTDEHLFSIYTTDFESTESVTEKFELFDLSGNLLSTRIVDATNDGVYLMYKVKGSFKLKATVLAGYATHIEGFFFDEIPSNTLSALQLSYASPRQVDVSWVNADTDQGISIERKKSTESEFVPIAAVAGTVSTYRDSDLDAGSTYEYRLRAIDGHKPSDPNEPESITLPAYTSIDLQFASPAYSLPKPGLNAAIEAGLEDASGNPLPGKTVRFELQGPYVGTYIDAAIGSAVTDSGGLAVISYTPEYSGNYRIVASVPYDDGNQIDKAEATVTLTVYNEAWERPPVILRVSDAVKPDTLFSVNGYGMNGSDMNDVQAKISKATGAAPATPPLDATELVLEQTDAGNGFFVTPRFPDTVTGGVYDIWVKNEFGWSSPARINVPRPLFLSEYEAYSGLNLELSGRNFSAAEFGSAGETMIRLQDENETSYYQTIKRLTPYSIEFTVGTVPTGTYFVDVSNDGGVTWARLDNGQRLSIVVPSSNPLGLNVAWAKEFAWSSVFNVNDYGAWPDDAADDTASVRDAVYAAKMSGGGVVYFPAGSYHLTHIDIPADIVLLGEDEATTFLYHTGTGTANFIRSSGDGKTLGRQGIAHLALRLSDAGRRPDSFIWLGGDWGPAVTDQTLRTAEKLFVYHVDIDYPMTVQPSGAGRGMGMIFIAKERVVFEENHFKGYHASSEASYIGSYASYKNNYFEYAAGTVTTFAQYSFVTGNHLVNHPEFGADAHGIFGRNNVHMADNIVENMGPDSPTNGDGEPLAVEMPEAYLNEGKVLGATANDLTIVPATPLKASYPLRYSYLAVVITDGKGMGQLRKVTGITGSKLAIDRSWDVIPDGTSKMTLIAPNDNVTFHRNTILNNAKGIWFYGNAIDGVAADNISEDSEGIFVYTSQVKNQSRFTPDYYIRVTGNIITGVSRRSGHSGIYINSQRTGVNGRYYGVSAYGIEIRDNRVEGVPSAVPLQNTEAPAESGILSWSAQLSSDASPSSESGDNTNVIIENNRLHHLNKGIHLSLGDYGHILKGNAFTAVTTPVHYRGVPVNEVILNDSYKDVRAPFWAAGSLASTEHSGAGLALSWDAAADNTAVTRYTIYQNGALLDSVDGTILSYEIEGLSTGQEYEFRIEAEDASGNRSIDYLTVRTVF
ncbi:glycosyl hydrolase family 28-related protein [Paenibacillus contaminans]|uniref:Fibronectin type-III domain-containing protein n=1 Tax=Paenibacillus contaminans TaxID=450362 RepID=A0A329MK46_9BACL|nr:glycosyl hydrolase family 28-related protein [Paenibacillus contaminans]RAV19696.1 hypothetical protein DQG23_19760 [Paenibacillus contaminans]